MQRAWIAGDAEVVWRLRASTEWEPMSTRFGEALRSLREGAGLSLYALARRVNWSKAAIGHAETGTRLVSPDLAKALDNELGANGLLIALASEERDHRRTVDEVRRRTLLGVSRERRSWL